jgi:predicted phosphoribosyltransferase
VTPRERHRRQEARDRATAERLADSILREVQLVLLRRTFDALRERAVAFVDQAIAIGRTSEAAKRLRAAKGTGAAKARRAYGVRRGSW